RPTSPTLFPYTTLFRSDRDGGIDVRAADVADRVDGREDRKRKGERDRAELSAAERVVAGQEDRQRHGARTDEHEDRRADDLGDQDRKSTRLNSSHRTIS